MANKITSREPFVRMVKRSTIPWWKAWLIRAGAILAALVVCAVVTVLFTGENPFKIYATMFEGALGSPGITLYTFQNVAMLLCVGLAVTPAFKMRFWNIGAEGQVLAGALATAAVMILLTGKVPDWTLIPIMAIASVSAGLIWAMIPALGKTLFGTNDTLFTLMMNYVAMQLVAFFVVKWEVPEGSGSIGVINLDNNEGWFPKLFGQNYIINILIVALLTVFLFIYLKYSKHGYEIAVVGESDRTAKYVGINVNKVILRTMALSGALCGVAGLLLVAGTGHTVTTSTAGGRGFTAIMVSWLAKFNPLYMILTAFLLVFLDRGAGEIATNYRLNKAFADVISSIILLFIIGCEFFINYRLVFRGSKREDK